MAEDDTGLGMERRDATASPGKSHDPYGVAALRTGIVALLVDLFALVQALIPDDSLLPVELGLTFLAAAIGIPAVATGIRGLADARREGHRSRKSGWGLALGALAIGVFLATLALTLTDMV